MNIRTFLNSKKGRILYWTTFGILVAVFLFASFMIAAHYYQVEKSEGQFEDLAELTEQVPEETPEEEDTAPKELAAAEKYQAIKAQNDDFVGWIKIEGTRIDYPVVQTPHKQNYYLRRGFDKKYSYYGVPFAAENCDVHTSDNVVIYGHNIKNGAMFSDLEKYRSKSYFESHRYITFDTMEGFGTYEVLAVFQTVSRAEDEFEYFLFDDGDAEEFSAYVAKCKELSFYDTGVTATDGDRLITLSTCEYTHRNGRFAVVAKKIS